MQILISWIGLTDLRAAAEQEEGPGPVLRLLDDKARRFDRVHLLNDLPPAVCRARGVREPDEYVQWLADESGIPVGQITRHDFIRNNEPANLGNRLCDTFLFTKDILEEICSANPPDTKFALLASPGSPAAQAAMLLMWLTRFDRDTELLKTSKERGVEVEEVPFSLRVDLSPSRVRLRNKGNRAIPGQKDRSILRHKFPKFLGESQAVMAVLHEADRAAQSEASVMLLGETGTGKEILAREIHDGSRRCAKPFVPVNCAAFSETVVESELFGHVKGAFSGATAERKGWFSKADHGTLFLDELAEMSPATQVKLLRFLDDGTYSPVGSTDVRNADVRLIVATNRRPSDAISQGVLRGDLFYRVNTIPIRLPPLRYRGDDLYVLARAFVAEENRRQGQTFGQNWIEKSFSPGALDCLGRCPWPGNVRELRATVTRLVVLSDGPEITDEDVELLVEPQPIAEGTSRPISQLSKREFLTQLAADIDELLRRMENLIPGGNERRDIVDDVLQPLVVGRALNMAGNPTRAGILARGSKYDLREDRPEYRYKERYAETWEDLINEATVARIRGEPAVPMPSVLRREKES